MQIQYVKSDETVEVAVVAYEDALTKLTGSTYIAAEVRRLSDGYYYDWNDATFKTYGSISAANRQKILTEDSNMPGRYATSWDLSGITNAAAGDETYDVMFVDTNSPQDIGIDLGFGQLVVSWVDDIIADIAVVDGIVDGLVTSLATVDTNVDQALVDIATVDGKVVVVDANVDQLLLDVATVDANVDQTLLDLATVDGNVDQTLVDVAAVDAKVVIVDANVDQALLDIAAVEAKVDIVDTTADQLIVNVAAVQTVVDLLQGLCLGNTFIDSYTYDANQHATSHRIRTFPDAATAALATDGGVGEGETNTITITSTPHGTYLGLPATILSVVS